MMTTTDPVAAALEQFDLEAPVFPPELEEIQLTDGGYPYDKRLKKKNFERQLRELQIELVKLQKHIRATGERLVMVFEGRDAAGKGSSIFNFRRYINPRHARVVALAKPTERERGEWYFQRYAEHLPTAGEMVLFDRSWYNRAGVEPVMGFCTPEQAARFLTDAPRFEEALVRDGVKLIKFWLNIGRVTQLKRFHDRRHDPLKIWKLSPIDIKALDLFDAYSHARDEMLAATSTPIAPWTVIRMNDKRRGRLEVIRHVLRQFDYEDRDDRMVGMPDPAVIGLDPAVLRGE